MGTFGKLQQVPMRKAAMGVCPEPMSNKLKNDFFPLLLIGMLVSIIFDLISFLVLSEAACMYAIGATGLFAVSMLYSYLKNANKLLKPPKDE